jgi:hypothetical protein
MDFTLLYKLGIVGGCFHVSVSKYTQAGKLISPSPPSHFFVKIEKKMFL